MENKKKAIISLVIVVLTLVALVIGASYAYFSVTSTNSFGSKTISASAPDMGSVALVGDNNLTLNLSAADMMKKSVNTSYYGTYDGTTATIDNIVAVAHAQVTGAGTFNCNYTLNVTATGTNNLYTAFQGWSGKSTNQINLYINGVNYDFYVSNLFPITISGTMYGLSSSKSKPITASIRMVNSRTLDQSVLANKDISITVTATSFSCSAAEPPQAYYYVYDSTKSSNKYISDPLTSNAGLSYYLKGYGVTGVYDEVCGVFNGAEYCLQPASWGFASTYRSEMEALGATCSHRNEFYHGYDLLGCGFGNIGCNVLGNGEVNCVNHSLPESCGFEAVGARCQDPS